MKMVRKQVYITQEQDELLKRLAQIGDRSEAEIIRDALDGLGSLGYERGQTTTGRLREAALMEYRTEDQASGVKLGVNSSSGRVLDDKAWEEELAFMRSLAERAGDVKHGGKAWRFNRDEVYEQRAAKILRRH
jgi:hypothetical protein